MTDAFSEYKKRLDTYSKDLGIINNKIKSVSNLRLFVFVAFTAAAVLIFRTHHYVYFAIDIICGIVAFTAAVIWHNDLYRKRDIIKKYITINETACKRTSGEWGDFKDRGEEFIDHEHPYSWDLDMFGLHSVFQWICNCHTYRGRLILAHALSDPLEEIDHVTSKQAAVQELSALLDWRQNLELYGYDSGTGNNPEDFLRWYENKKATFKSRFVKAFFRSMPYASLLIGTVGFIITGTLLFFAIVYSIHLAVFGLLYSKTIKTIRSFEKSGSLLLSYSRLVELIEKQKFTSEYLDEIKAKLIVGKSIKASVILRKISNVINAAEVRSNPLAHLIANAVWLWDLQCVIKADNLKRKYGSDARQWIEVIGKFESLSSLSIIRFENQEWVFPLIEKNRLCIDVTHMGHPLLQNGIRVDNDFTIEHGNTSAIITGSNMSGKSTFLRTIGVNLVLAFSGAPVCAESFVCSPVKIFSSMRIYDDLSTKVSTFYAELLRIKKIVDAVRNDETALFLLDELFRGTNSQDRHDGAVAVLNALTNQKTIGIISTHDMELCKLAEHDKIKFVNYHFEEQYLGSTITFDYKLKPGQSTTKNAMFLIRMIGINN